jgi:alpha-1,2-glucosyltransferase
VVNDEIKDEVFHIPQAQAYCQGDFHIWDPKLTTPPGLYAFTTIYANLAGIRNCDVDTLRFFNNLALLFAMVYAGSCYASIAKLNGLKNLSVLHNMFNIALFPPLFFFSGLFYTDVLSTAVVLKMYRHFLQKRSGLWLYVTGFVALTMRQTNVFWTAVFLGGLEVVRTLKSIEVKKDEREAPRCFKGVLKAAFHRYERGEIHDISLKGAEVEGTSSPKSKAGPQLRKNRLLPLRAQHWDCCHLPPSSYLEEYLAIYCDPPLICILRLLERRGRPR